MVVGCIRGLLAAVFAFAAAAKLASGHDPVFALSPFAYRAVIAAELLIAGLLITRWWILGLWATVAFAIVACVAAFIWRGQACGCIGKVAEIGWRWRIVLLSALGATACYAIRSHLLAPGSGKVPLQGRTR